jgi:hypothetical protein
MTLYTRKILIALGAVIAAGVFVATASAAAPTNTAPPTVTGTEQQGKILTAHNGTWTGSPTFTYRWQRCDSDGTGCGNIDNAAAKTYTLTSTDVGRTVRVNVTGTNKDGQATASSKVTAVISGTAAPANTARPTVSGTPRPGEELTAATGTWSNGVRTYAFQWQHCDAAGANCNDVAGATGRTYGVRAADLGDTIRVSVTATNLVGSNTATSDRTEVVKTGTPPPTTSAANHRPTLAILSVRFVGARAYVRIRVCDDSRRNLAITERDVKAGVPSYTRHFRTLVVPRPCSALTRSFVPAPRFRHGRYTIRMWTRDYAGLTSRIASRTIVR